MAVTFTNLDTNSSTTDTTGSFTTASITPTANQPVLMALLSTVGSGSTAPTPVVTGCGLTWTLIDNTASGVRVAWVFLGIGASPTTGTLAIAGDGTTSVTAALWTVAQSAGVDTSTANGVVQHFSNKPAAGILSCSVAFANSVVATNGTFGCVGLNVQNLPSPGGGWTSLGTSDVTSPNSGLIAECQTSTAQQNVAASWTTSGNAFVIGLEMAATSVSPLVVQPHYRNRARLRRVVN